MAIYFSEEEANKMGLFKPVFKKDELKLLKTFTKNLTKLQKQVNAVDKQIGKVVMPYAKAIKTRKERDKFLDDLHTYAPHNSMGLAYLKSNLKKMKFDRKGNKKESTI